MTSQQIQRAARRLKDKGHSERSDKWWREHAEELLQLAAAGALTMEQQPYTRAHLLRAIEALTETPETEGRSR